MCGRIENWAVGRKGIVGKRLRYRFAMPSFLEGPRRTPLLIHEGPLRGTKNGNGNTFVRGGHGGPRRTATATSFCPERKKNTSFDPRRTLRATKNGNGNTFVRGGHGGPRRTAERNCNFFLIHERRTAKNTSFDPRRGHEERQRQHLCPRRTRRAAENGNCRTATATSFCPRRATKDREEHLF